MNTELLQKTKIGMIGLGAQGSAECQNLKRSGVDFVVGLRTDSPSIQRAKELGYKVTSLEEIARTCDTVVLNLPDQEQGPVYTRFFAQHAGIKRIVFAHGFNSHFGLIPLEVHGPDHILIAPKGAASGLTEFYGTRQALPAILSIRTKQALPHTSKEWVEAYAIAIGCHSKALIWADFKDETECDLFSEQSLLCGGVSSLLRAAFDTLVKNGYHPEAAYFETLYELKLIVDLIWKHGISGMRRKISPTARYGDITRGDRLIDSNVTKQMQEILDEIRNGSFAKEFLKGEGSSKYKQLEMAQAQHPIEILGEKIRRRMSETV